MTEQSMDAALMAPQAEVAAAATSEPDVHMAEVPNVVLPAADPSPSIAGSATSADGVATSSLNDASSTDKQPKTFEQMVEERFLTIERAISQLPHALHKALSEGSHESAEAFASRVLQHLFGAL